MSNSRSRFVTKTTEEVKPTNSSKGQGLILETPYKPGFVDDKDLETVKMAIDKELSEIANAFHETTERTANSISRIETLELSSNNDYGALEGKIEEIRRITIDGDTVLVEKIDRLTAETATAIGKNTALIEEESKARTDADSALAETVNTWKAEVDTEIGKNTAAIITTNKAYADADKVISERIDNILGAMEGDLGPLVGQFQEEIRVLGEKDQILVQQIIDLDASYKQADKDLHANVNTETTARVNADSALASQITTLRSDLTAEDGKLSSQITQTNKTLTDLTQTVAENKTELNSSITSSKNEAVAEAEKKAREELAVAQAALNKAIADGDLAEAERLKKEIDRLTGILEGYKKEIDAQLTILNTTTANLELALAQNKTELTASIGVAKDEAIKAAEKAAKTDLDAAKLELDKAILSGDENAIKEAQKKVDALKGEVDQFKGEINADLVQINQTLVNHDGAISKHETELTSKVGPDIVSLKSQMSTTVNKLGQVEAKWGIEMDANGKISGVSLNNDGQRSDFSIRADKFTFTDTSGKTSGGFTSSGGVTTFSGALQVADQSGNVGMKITNSQILIYDEAGRLRVKMGKL